MEISNLEIYIKEFIYYSEFGRGKKPNTIKCLKKDLEQLKNYVDRNKGIEKIDDITPLSIREFMMELQKETVGKRSVNRKISSLRVFFKYLRENEAIKKDPTTVINSPSFEITAPDILSIEEIKKLREVIGTKTCNGLRDRLILELLYSSGITSHELLSLGEKVFDLEKREFLVNNGKNNRIVFFSERSRKFLLGYIEAKKVKYGERYNPDILFVNGSATRISDRSLRRLIDRYAERAGITREISPYSFRHTFGAHMLLHGMNINFVKELMGHSTIESTKIYQEAIKKPIVINNFR